MLCVDQLTEGVRKDESQDAEQCKANAPACNMI